VSRDYVDTPTVKPSEKVALAVRGLRKSFAGTRALIDFDIELREGEVHGIVGGNGSGKSTFAKILAGVYQADAGEIERGGTVSSLTDQTPADARAMGLRFVHQDLGIVPILSVAENLALGDGYPVAVGSRIKWRTLRKQTRQVLERFNVEVDPRTPAGELTTPQQAMLAIARALQTIDESERGVLFLDEPTASLPPEEANILLTSIRQLAGQGHTIILVTHRLDEVKQAADRVTGIRDGIRAGTIETKDMTESDAVQLILGRRLENAEPPAVLQSDDSAQPILALRGLGDGRLHDIDFEIRPGEVVGIAGLLGAGRTEILQMIFGVRPHESGEILIDGERIARPNPRRMRGLGVAFVPENRQAEAIFPEQTVAQNMTAGKLSQYFGGVMNDRRMTREVVSDVGTYNVKTSSPSAGIQTLSGGNQQKVVLARWLRDKPRLILLDEPTQGIDVGAREEIFTLINQATESGAAVLLVSSEFEELTRLAHRVLVLSRGTITGELSRGRSAHDVFESVIETARSV
jgi:ribose transport system ATP-binding protein